MRLYMHMCRAVGLHLFVIMCHICSSLWCNVGHIHTTYFQLKNVLYLLFDSNAGCHMGCSPQATG